MNDTKRKVVITGGAGFIGSHVAEIAAAKGYKPVILDDLSSGKLDNIRLLVDRSDAEFVKGDIRDLPLLKKVCTGAQYVFHLAAIVSVPRSVDDPLESHVINATGTLNVLLAARDCAVRKVIFSSSCAVYGDAKQMPISEATPVVPLSPYAADKLSSENYLRLFHRLYGLPTIALRYFNVYGPRQDPGSAYAAVIPLFIQAALSGKPLTIFGDGEQQRDFIFVRDVAEANFLAAVSPETGIYNIGSGKGTGIRALAETIIRLGGNRTGRIEHAVPRAGDIRVSIGDARKAKALGFKPGTDLEDGLVKALSFLQEQSYNLQSHVYG